MSRRLKKYDFNRSFQLDRDLDRQDKLTTWIEYLGYEYYFYDGPASYVRAFQRRHDEAWTKLVESNVLRPEDTYESIRNIEAAFRDANERERAEKEMNSAAAAVAHTKKAISETSAPGANLRARLLRDQSILVAATERHKTIKVRDDSITAFLEKTRRYRCKKGEADRHSCLLRWIERQIPSIELELGSLIGAEDDPNRTNSSRGTKRARLEQDTTVPPRKRRRQGGDAQPLSIGRASPDQTSSMRGTKRARSVEDTTVPPPKRRREGGDKQSLSAGRATLVPPASSQRVPQRSNESLIDNGQSTKRIKKSSEGSMSNVSKTAASVSMTSAPMSGTRATQELEGRDTSPAETVHILRPILPPSNRNKIKRRKKSPTVNGQSTKRIKKSSQSSIPNVSKSTALASMTAQPISNTTRATRGVKGGNASAAESASMLRPLRRSARLAAQRKSTLR